MALQKTGMSNTRNKMVPQILICYSGIDVGTLELSDIPIQNEKGDEIIVEIEHDGRVQLTASQDVKKSLDGGVLWYFKGGSPSMDEKWNDNPPLSIYKLEPL